METIMVVLVVVKIKHLSKVLESMSGREEQNLILMLKVFYSILNTTAGLHSQFALLCTFIPLSSSQSGGKFLIVH